MCENLFAWCGIANYCWALLDPRQRRSREERIRWIEKVGQTKVNEEEP